MSHTVCLGEHFVSSTNELVCLTTCQISMKQILQVPVSGQCPTCEGQELWGDLIKKKRGCYSQVLEQLPLVNEEDEEIY